MKGFSSMFILFMVQHIKTSYELLTLQTRTDTFSQYNTKRSYIKYELYINLIHIYTRIHIIMSLPFSIYTIDTYINRWRLSTSLMQILVRFR